MRFDTLEAFLAHFYENKLNIADIEFSVVECEPEPAVNADVIVEPEPVADAPADEPRKLEEELIAYLPSGPVTLEIDAEGYALVEAYEMVPNACGTGYVVIGGSKIFLNMCDCDGETAVRMDTNLAPGREVKVRVKK